MSSDVSFVAGEADPGLRERLDEEISAFNAAVTGHHDGRLLSIAVRRDGGDLREGSTGGRGADAATSSCSGCATTGAAVAWEPGSSLQPRPRSGVAVATGSP
jgi:hypothetical protein